MIKHLHLQSLKHYRAKPLKMHGRGFFESLKKIGDTLQGVVETIAPITSKLAGPIATALTGVPIPNLSAVSPTNLLPAAQKIAEKNQDNDNIPDKIKTLMRAALQKGTEPKTDTKGAGHKKRK